MHFFKLKKATYIDTCTCSAYILCKVCPRHRCKCWQARSCFVSSGQWKCYCICKQKAHKRREMVWYCATQREMLALVWASCHFWPYLYGRKFVLQTDHSALQWLHSFKEPEGKMFRGDGWVQINRPGKQHCNADLIFHVDCVVNVGWSPLHWVW